MIRRYRATAKHATRDSLPMARAWSHGAGAEGLNVQQWSCRSAQKPIGTAYNRGTSHHIMRTALRAPANTMPIYEYACLDCGAQHEHIQKLADAPISACPNCGSSHYFKKISAAGFALKGTGWYATDFKGGSKASDAPKAADSKPADAAAPAPAPACAACTAPAPSGDSG